MDDYEKFFDDSCDYCKARQKKNCGDLMECPEGFDFFDCCEDNLKKNVGELCFKYNVPQTIAVVLIKILEKERERNECLYVHREYIEESGTEECRNNHCAEIHSSREPQNKG